MSESPKHLIDALLPVVRTHKLEPVLVIALYALLPFTAVIENLGIVLGVDAQSEKKSNMLKSSLNILSSRAALNHFIAELEES